VQQRVEGEGGGLGVVEVADEAGEVEWRSRRGQEVLAAEVVDGEAEVVGDGHLRGGAAEVEPRLREQGPDSASGEVRVVGPVEQDEQAQDQRDGGGELAAQVGQLGRHDLHRAVRRDVVEDDVAEHVKPSAARAAGRLAVVQGRQVDRIAGEDDGLAWHVDTHRQGSRGDDDSEVALSE